MNTLDDFISRTEEQSSDIRATAKISQVEYPFLYLEKVTNVELRYWKQLNVLNGMKASDNDVALYLKRDSLKLLGYVTINMATFKALSSYSQRRIMFKKAKEVEEPVTDNILSYLLLGE